MRREIREVKDGILQITAPDERWYARKILKGELAFWDYVPSVTWICDTGWPKGIGFMKWLAAQGWSEAERIRAAAGDKGGKVHQAIHVLVSGGAVSFEDSFENPRTSQQEPLTPAEYECLMSFVDWFNATRPEVIASEYTVWNEKYRYAGTVDLKCRIKGRIWLIDCKTSAEVWPSFELQVSAYKHADDFPKAERLAILQLGYRKNKIKKWKWNPVSDQFQLFLSARRIWQRETEGIVPLQRDYPLSLSLNQQLNP